VKLKEFRQEMERFRERVDREALELKDSYLAVDRLSALYEEFNDSERALADEVLCEWVLSENEAIRFDAMALIRQFGVFAAVPALRRRGGRLEGASEPGAPFEREKVEALIDELTSDTGSAPS
jgi:hypothetical protein